MYFLNFCFARDDIWKKIQPTFECDPLALRTFVTIFSPIHLLKYASELPLDVCLANLYYHLKVEQGVNAFPVRFQVYFF